jgi:hypothetical protein
MILPKCGFWDTQRLGTGSALKAASPLGGKAANTTRQLPWANPDSVCRDYKPRLFLRAPLSCRSASPSRARRCGRGLIDQEILALFALLDRFGHPAWHCTSGNEIVSESHPIHQYFPDGLFVESVPPVVSASPSRPRSNAGPVPNSPCATVPTSSRRPDRRSPTKKGGHPGQGVVGPRAGARCHPASTASKRTCHDGEARLESPV